MSKKRKNNKTKKINKILITLIITLILAGLIYLKIDLDIIDTIGKVANIDTSSISNIITNNEIKEESKKTEYVAKDNLEVYYIDVGQADSILITNQNESMLIDAGNNEDGKDVVKFIKEHGISKLNYIVGTHPHEDHIGGLDDVINEIEVQNVLMPKIQTNTKTFEDVLDAISNKGLKITAPTKGEKFNIGDANCEIMTDSIEDTKNLNLSSIIIRLTFGNNSFLFMGDAETQNEKTITWPKTDVLKVGHHGSNTSSSESFLNQVKPTYAIIMVGKDNSYGLPKDNIIERLKKNNTKIYRTDEDKTIQITSNGNDIAIK